MRVGRELVLLCLVTGMIAVSCSAAGDGPPGASATATTVSAQAQTAEPTSTTEPETTTTTTMAEAEPTTTTTTTVYVGSVMAVFDGESCSSDGPTDFAVGKRLQWILQNNSSDGVVAYGLWKVLDGTTKAEIAAMGIDAVAVGDTRILLDWFERNSSEGAAEPGDRLSWPSPLDEVGTWAVVCVADGIEYPALIIEVSDA